MHLEYKIQKYIYVFCKLILQKMYKYTKCRNGK